MPANACPTLICVITTLSLSEEPSEHGLSSPDLCPACEEDAERIPARPDCDFDWSCSNCGWAGTDECA
jgi:hypothetical protein